MRPGDVYRRLDWIDGREVGGPSRSSHVCVPGSIHRDTVTLVGGLTVDQLAISDFIEHEVVRVLTGKFHREPGALRVVLDEILRWAYRVQIQHAVPGVCRDPNDDPILQTAVAAQAELLVAGDRDLLSLKSFHGIGIVTPVDYLSMSFPG